LASFHPGFPAPKIIQGVVVKNACFFIAVVFAWIAPGSAALADGAAAAGSVKTAEAPAWIVRGSEQIPAEPGGRLMAGDTLRTGPDGALGVVLRDNTLFSMGPESELVLNEFVFEPRESRFALVANMVKGTFSFLSGLIGKLSPESAKILTPVGTVGIRGTRFYAKVEEAR
jgi:hypothetical protein